MRGVSLTLQVVLFLAAAYGLAVVALTVLETWDDWVVLSVLAVGVFGVALMIYQSDYPSRSLKRRFGRSSGPDAPQPVAKGSRR
jgi:hypothetical protein